MKGLRSLQQQMSRSAHSDWKAQLAQPRPLDTVPSLPPLPVKKSTPQPAQDALYHQNRPNGVGLGVYSPQRNFSSTSVSSGTSRSESVRSTPVSSPIKPGFGNVTVNLSQHMQYPQQQGHREYAERVQYEQQCHQQHQPQQQPTQQQRMPYEQLQYQQHIYEQQQQHQRQQYYPPPQQQYAPQQHQMYSQPRSASNPNVNNGYVQDPNNLSRVPPSRPIRNIPTNNRTPPPTAPSFSRKKPEMLHVATSLDPQYYSQGQQQFQPAPPQPRIVSESSMRSDLKSGNPAPAPKRSPSLPLPSPKIREAVPARNAYAPDANTSSNTPPSPTTKRKSPIVAQSLNFLKGNRNFSSSSLSQNTYNSNDVSSSSVMDKYHQPSKQAIGSRVVPQKIPEPEPLVKKNKSLGSLTRRVTSSASLRSSGDKQKFNGMSQKSFSQKPSIKIKGSYIYPALLSEVGLAFKDNIQLGDHYKNGIMYRDSFTGSDAIDIICQIARTNDRNLGIILGRALDAQRFFHDVTYEHRIRDNIHEIYKFNDAIYEDDTSIKRNNSVLSTTNSSYYESIMDEYTDDQNQQQQMIPKGVFTYLTQCYSPTCTREKLCYSISCPRRLQQQMREEMKMSSIIRSDSHLGFNIGEEDDQKQYWQLTVPKSILESLDKDEIKRQEGIFEVVSSEKAFVKDLEYIREFWIRPLSETKIIKDKERENFIRTVFHNINEIWNVNHKFAEALIRRQQKSSIVESVADIFLEYIPQFKPFETYGAGQVVGKYEFDRQRKINPLLRRFVEDTSKRAESKRLDLSSFLSKPTTRPARYPLLLKTIQNHTDPNSEEYKKLGTCIKLLETMLTTINYETGKQADKMHLFQLRQKLLFKPGELVDLKLNADSRKLIYQCVLKKKGYQEKENQGEIHVYLFDHCLLFIKVGYLNKKEVFKVYQRPIPLSLLFFSLSEFSPSMKQINRASNLTGSSTALVGGDLSLSGINGSASNLNNNNANATSPISFKYIGEHGYELLLYGTPQVQKMLASKIESQTNKLIKDNDVFTLTTLSSQYFNKDNTINCVTPFDGGRKLIFGTDSGIYIGDRTRTGPNSKPIKIISKLNIIQADILEEYQILLALNDKKLMYWPLDILNGRGDPVKNAKMGKELMGHVSFFKIGVCDGRKLVCAAKSSSNIVRIFEPVDPVTQKRTKKKFLNTLDDLTFTSEPVSVSFLKTKLCIGCSRGFEIVSLSNGTKEVLLDPADTSLEFASSKEGLKPLEIDRINSDFLLSYSTFSFFINHNGWRVKPKWMIQWEGEPHAFALWYPYLLAFGSSFIEIRNVSNAELLRVIVADNIRFLHASSQEILYVYTNEAGYDVVASLDFWDKSVKNRSRSGTEVMTVNGTQIAQ